MLEIAVDDLADVRLGELEGVLDVRPKAAALGIPAFFLWV
jgi:hypothetical protein